MATRVVIVRGHLVTPWELRPWRELPDRFEVSYLMTGSNQFEPGDLGLRAIKARALRDRMPGGRLGEVATGVLGDRYLQLDRALDGADVVHAEELHFWFAAEAARAKKRLGYKLVQTVWETLPMLGAFRNRHARQNRLRVLEATDLFLPATERARDALLLEGVDPERIEVCPPGIDLARFQGAPSERSDQHVIISPGRLVWEKGHHDVLRAVAAIHRDLLGDVPKPRVMIVGSGPERERLLAHATELGIGPHVEITSVPYDEMPATFARASCMVLASVPSATAAYHLFDVPRAFWEEQFGLVLAEAMAAGLAIVASTSGAIPEVVGDGGRYFPGGDFMALARELAAGPLSRPAGERVQHDRERLERYSTTAMAGRLASAYDRLTAA